MVSQKEYIKNYNKNNYKMYQFRIRQDDLEMINYLDSIQDRNHFIAETLRDVKNKSHVLTIKQIKSAIKPILNKHGISEIYLFGSYARGEAGSNSDVDIYCDKGDIRTLFDLTAMEEELSSSLGKKIDLVFTSSQIDTYFKERLMEDLIKLC